MKYIVFLLLLLVISCSNKKEITTIQSTKNSVEQTIKDTILFSEKNISYKFDFPVAKPNAKGYYNAQKFQENNHLGDDWNSIKGGNSDLGDTIYAISKGYISSAKNYEGGWGNVIRIIHFLPNNKKIESLYAHCDTIFSKPKTWVKRGQAIGTIGNVNGLYFAHLHLEIRNKTNMPVGNGYSKETLGYLDPTKFIKNHRTISK
jgi:hypothetical protein